MKNLLKGALIAACIFLTGSFAQAQSKIGYVNFQQLVTTDPAFSGIQTQINAYQKTFIDVLQTMNTEYQTKAADYESKRTTMSDALRTKAEGELQDLQKRINETNTNAQNQVNQKSDELTKPLIDKYKAAVSQVAKEKGYNYVFDSSSVAMIVSPEGDDLLASVKAKVGTSAAAPAATPVRPTAKKP